MTVEYRRGQTEDVSTTSATGESEYVPAINGGGTVSSIPQRPKKVGGTTEFQSPTAWRTRGRGDQAEWEDDDLAGTRSDRAEAEVTRLHNLLHSQGANEEWLISDVAGDDVATFILFKIVEAGGLPVRDLASRLAAPTGWVAFSRLCGARLVDVWSDVVIPTKAGEDLIELLADATI